MPLFILQRYRISGLTVLSAVPLPALDPLPETSGSETSGSETSGPPDVRLLLRPAEVPLPDALPDPVASGPFWTLTATALLLSVPGLGRVQASNGTLLEVDPDPGVPVEEILPFALGTGLAGLLYQRDSLLLHASAVADGDNAILLCGPSGMGKSTLAAALCRQGCSLICDDVARITLPPDGSAGPRPVIWPDGRALKLFPPSITRLNLHGQQGQPVRRDLDKYYVIPPPPPVIPSSASGHPARPVTALYILSDHRPGMTEGIEAVTGLDVAQALLHNSYRPRLALGMARAGVSSALQRVTPVVQAQVAVFTLVRQRDLDRLDRLATTLLEHARQSGTHQTGTHQSGTHQSGPGQ